MELNYFDSHCHPQLSAFDADRADVLERMRRNGVGGLVVGTDLETSRAAVGLAAQHDFLWAAIGLHPNDNPGEALDFETYLELAKQDRVVAIGECGLDYYRQEPTEEARQAQHARFSAHMEIAQKVGKPLMIHCRPTRNSMNAHREMLELLSREPHLKAVMHFFTGNVEVAKQYLALGCYLSFPGVVTFTNEYDEVVRETPLDRILSETDSPFAAPVPYRGKRNEPAYVEKTVERLAQLKGVSKEEMAAQTVKNAIQAFGFKP